MDDTEQLQGNDVPVSDPPAYAPAPPAAPNPVTFTGVTSGPRPPQDIQAEIRRRQQQANDTFWRNLQAKTANMPMAQTEQAVAAALRFQGQRQYQRDLASGMSQAEAFARSAPLIFSAPRQGTIGQAASFIDATKQQNKYHDVGGVLYRENPNGTVTRVTGPAPPKFHSAGGMLYREEQGGALTPMTQGTPKVSQFDEEDYRSATKELEKLNEQYDTAGLGDTEKAALIGQMNIVRSRLGQIRGRSQGAPSMPAPSQIKTARVRVRAPSGKYGSIPASQLKAALAAGYSQIQ